MGDPYTQLAHHLHAQGMVDEIPTVDEEVRTGCGLYPTPSCAEAVRLECHTGVAPPATSAELHRRIQGRQGLVGV